LQEKAIECQAKLLNNVKRQQLPCSIFLVACIGARMPLARLADSAASAKPVHYFVILLGGDSYLDWTANLAAWANFTGSRVFAGLIGLQFRYRQGLCSSTS